MSGLVITEQDRERLVRAACQIMRNPDDAEEVVQDALLRAWVRRACFRGECSAFTYLSVCVRHRCLEVIRKKRIATLSLDEIVEASGDFPAIGRDQRIEEAFDARRTMDRVFRRLPKKFHAIAGLMAEDLGPVDIHKRLRISEASAKTLVFRTRTAMKAMAAKV